MSSDLTFESRAHESPLLCSRISQEMGSPKQKANVVPAHENRTDGKPPGGSRRSDEWTRLGEHLEAK